MMDGDDPICYYRAPVKKFLTDRKIKDKEKEKNKNGPPMQWVSFLPD